MTMKTLRQKIGQLFLVGCQGEALCNDERLLIEEYQFAGLVLFNINCGAPAQLVSLCRDHLAVVRRRPALHRHRPGRRPGSSAAGAVQPFSRRRAHRRAPRPRTRLRLGSATAAELTLAGDQSELRAGARCPVQSATVRSSATAPSPRAARRGDRNRSQPGPGTARRRRYPLRQTLSRPRRRRERFAL